MTTYSEQYYFKGSRINVIENTFWTPDHKLGEAFEEDFIFVSNGFMTALNNGLTPVESISILDKNKDGEWHHVFVKQADNSFDAYCVRFN